METWGRGGPFNACSGVFFRIRMRVMAAWFFFCVTVKKALGSMRGTSKHSKIRGMNEAMVYCMVKPVIV
jgi:hypothetical protein